MKLGCSRLDFLIDALQVARLGLEKVGAEQSLLDLATILDAEMFTALELEEFKSHAKSLAAVKRYHFGFFESPRQVQVDLYHNEQRNGFGFMIIWPTNSAKADGMRFSVQCHEGSIEIEQIDQKPA